MTSIAPDEASDLVQVDFDFEGQNVRTVIVHGEPWWVASDVARILGYRMASDMTRRLDDDERGTSKTRTPSGDQTMTVVSEAGLYSAIMRSEMPEARAFKRWITHEVLPSIRRNGTYASAVDETPLETIARAAVLAQEMLSEMAPRAQAWTDLAASEGSLEVGDAAKLLSNAGIDIGRQRLFVRFADLGWTYRGSTGAWRVKQTALEAGYLVEQAQTHRHPQTGQIVLDPPQVRVTPRGLDRLRSILSDRPALESAAR